MLGFVDLWKFIEAISITRFGLRLKEFMTWEVKREIYSFALRPKPLLDVTLRTGGEFQKADIAQDVQPLFRVYPVLELQRQITLLAPSEFAITLASESSFKSGFRDIPRESRDRRTLPSEPKTLTLSLGHDTRNEAILLVFEMPSDRSVQPHHDEVSCPEENLTRRISQNLRLRNATWRTDTATSHQQVELPREMLSPFHEVLLTAVVSETADPTYYWIGEEYWELSLDSISVSFKGFEIPPFEELRSFINHHSSDSDSATQTVRNNICNVSQH
jgi:hypothetical protein